MPIYDAMLHEQQSQVRLWKAILREILSLRVPYAIQVTSALSHTLVISIVSEQKCDLTLFSRAHFGLRQR